MNGLNNNIQSQQQENVPVTNTNNGDWSKWSKYILMEMQRLSRVTDNAIRNQTNLDKLVSLIKVDIYNKLNKIEESISAYPREEIMRLLKLHEYSIQNLQNKQSLLYKLLIAVTSGLIVAVGSGVIGAFFLK